MGSFIVGSILLLLFFEINEVLLLTTKGLESLFPMLMFCLHITFPALVKVFPVLSLFIQELVLPYALFQCKGPIIIDPFFIECWKATKETLDFYFILLNKIHIP